MPALCLMLQIKCYAQNYAGWFSRLIEKSGNGSLKRLDTTADSFVKHRKLALRL